MPLLFAFRLSLYLSLGTACACLGYAELPVLPEITAFAALVAVLLVVAFRCEGRWALSTAGANLLGAGLILALFGWIAARVGRPAEALARFHDPATLLPFVGPIAMVQKPTWRMPCLSHSFSVAFSKRWCSAGRRPGTQW